MKLIIILLMVLLLVGCVKQDISEMLCTAVDNAIMEDDENVTYRMDGNWCIMEEQNATHTYTLICDRLTQEAYVMINSNGEIPESDLEEMQDKMPRGCDFDDY